MAVSAAAKAIALVLFLAAVAGATWGVGEVLGVSVEAQPVAIEPVHTERQATAGHTVSYLVTVLNRGITERSVVVEVTGAATGRSDAVTIPAAGSLAVFVPVALPDDIPVGEHTLNIRVLSGDTLLRARDNALDLEVLPAAPGLAVGDRAEIRYVGRIADTGRTFATNDPLLVGASLLKTDSYQYSDMILPVSTMPRNVVLGIYEGMLGMQPGETRTMTFGFEKGYGPPSQQEKVPRLETIPRALTVANEPQAVTRATFDSHITSTGQGDPATYTVGSTFTDSEEQNTWTYRLTHINSTRVEYQLDAKVGDAFTFYPYWPQGTVVQEITDESITFYTTPTTAPAVEGACPPPSSNVASGCFTMRAEWPDMSTLQSTNDTHMVVRHDPPVNFRYTTLQAGQNREVVIAELRPDEVVIAVAAQHPLAGKPLTFDITVLTVTKPAS